MTGRNTRGQGLGEKRERERNGNELKGSFHRNPISEYSTFQWCFSGSISAVTAVTFRRGVTHVLAARHDLKRKLIPVRRRRARVASSAWKRIGIITTGWFFIVLGVVGLFLPVLQGALFLLIGLVILSAEYHWAKRLLANLRSRFPKLDGAITAAHDKAAAILRRDEKPDQH